MTTLPNEKGKMIPITVLSVEPNVVVQTKTKGKDGYEAVQVGAGSKRKISKPLKGHMNPAIEKSGVKDLVGFRFLREFRLDQPRCQGVGAPTGSSEDLKDGDKLEVSMFAPGDVVKVSGVSKGKGFAGAMKRHGFHGMPHSHGHHHVARHIGSIGQRFPQHTLKGKRMAGRMGADKVSVRGLKVITVDIENNLLAVQGSVPGNKGSMVKITA